VRRAIRQSDHQGEHAEPEQQQRVATLAPAPHGHHDPGEEGEAHQRIEQRQMRDVVLAFRVTPEVEHRNRPPRVIGEPER